MNKSQYVCLVCGYNMIGECPDQCPFCGAGRDRFLTAAEASAHFRVVETPITESLSRVSTEPAIGLEHAAYRLDTGENIFLIDCPVVFDPQLRPFEVITFTHPHFLGACNLYRKAYGAAVWIHAADAVNPLARAYSFDRCFESGFMDSGLEAHPVNGHTPGFTVYIHDDTLFPCDLVFPEQDSMRFNPYGPERPTRDAGVYLWKLIEGRQFARVCGWHYVMDFGVWREEFKRLLETSGAL